MKKYLTHMIPAAVAMAAALNFGVQIAQAQTSTSTDTATSASGSMATGGMKKPASALGGDSTNPPAVGTTPKDPAARTAAMAEKKAAREAKKAARPMRSKTDTMGQSTGDSATPAAAAK